MVRASICVMLISSIFSFQMPRLQRIDKTNKTMFPAEEVAMMTAEEVHLRRIAEMNAAKKRRTDNDSAASSSPPNVGSPSSEAKDDDNGASIPNRCSAAALIRDEGSKKRRNINNVTNPHTISRKWRSTTNTDTALQCSAIFNHHILQNGTNCEELLTDLNITKMKAIIQNSPALLHNAKSTFYILADTLKSRRETHLLSGVTLVLERANKTRPS